MHVYSPVRAARLQKHPFILRNTRQTWLGLGLYWVMHGYAPSRCAEPLAALALDWGSLGGRGTGPSAQPQTEIPES